jgi:iron complex outermembrane recepter protein
VKRNAAFAAAAAAVSILVSPHLLSAAETAAASAAAQDTRPAASEPDRPAAYVETDTIDVTAEWPPVSAVQCLAEEELPDRPVGDGAEMLRDVPGVAIGRMGGHGLEPRIRGLGEANLNILVDGAYVHGGCPNRMDPPTSFAAPETFDQVTVLKGVQSLRYGAGGSGGTVLYERTPPELADRSWRVDTSSAFSSWHDSPEITADASWRSGRFYLRGLGGARAFDNYEDGDGQEVRSAYEHRNTDLIAGYGSAEKGLVELGVEATRTDDALFAGAGMDSPMDAGDTYRLELRRDDALGRWSDLRAELYLAEVEHLMDNYSLRVLTGPMAMRVPSTSDTFGGRLSAERGFGGDTQVTFGLDHQENQREALRFAGPDATRVGNLQSVLWPDARLSQTGIYAEGHRALDDAWRVRFGSRVDRFSAQANAADLDPVGMNRSPNELYQLYYGTRAEDWSDTDWSALLRLERSWRSGLSLFTGISRSVRAADATERYLGSHNAVAMQRWVGNPKLDLAASYQLDLGLSAARERYDWSATGFVNEVDGFILRDRARGQDGILLSDLAAIYRNVDARLYGLELSGTHRFGQRFTGRGSASYVHGENRTDGRPLAEIPPLQGLLGVDADLGKWSAGAAVRWAIEQDRVDDDPRIGSGLDFGPTPGYAVVDLSTTYRLAQGLAVVAGIDNLLDETYANHLNRGNLFDPDPIRVNEPGRTTWVRLRWKGGAVR